MKPSKVETVVCQICGKTYPLNGCGLQPDGALLRGGGDQS